MGQLDGKTVIVTGAAQGIGAAYARGLAKEGANVVVNDVLDPSSLVDEITEKGGIATGIVADVTNETQIADMVLQTVNKYGRIDGLINNAALFGKLARRRFEEIDIDEFDSVMRVNIRGVWQVSRAVVAVMRKQEYGKIVNIASTAAFQGTPGITRYAASKAAVVGITRSMAREYGEDGIRINAIAPGPIETETGAAIETEEGRTRRVASGKKRALGRNGMPQDVVGLCIFLSSPQSDFMTGQTVVVDGGGTMW